MTLPFTTYAPLKGFNVDPAALEELRQRNEREKQRRREYVEAAAFDREQSLVDRMFRERAAKFNEDESMYYRGLKGKELDDAIAARAQARADRERDRAASEKKYQDDVAFRERDFAQRQRSEERVASQQEEARRILSEKEAAAQAKMQQQADADSVRVKARAIIAERVPQLAQALSQAPGLAGGLGGEMAGATPETLRDMMMAETQDADLTPEDRAAVQAAIAEWYQDELKREDTDARRSYNAALLDEKSADRERKQEDADAVRKARTDAAEATRTDKANAEQNKVKGQRLALIDRKMARYEKQRENAAIMLQAAMEAGDAGKDAVNRWATELKELDQKIADLELEEDALLKE